MYRFKSDTLSINQIIFKIKLILLHCVRLGICADRKKTTHSPWQATCVNEFLARPISITNAAEFAYLPTLMGNIQDVMGITWTSGEKIYWWTDFYGTLNGNMYTFTRGKGGAGKHFHIVQENRLRILTIISEECNNIIERQIYVCFGRMFFAACVSVMRFKLYFSFVYRWLVVGRWDGSQRGCQWDRRAAGVYGAEWYVRHGGIGSCCRHWWKNRIRHMSSY